jgi:hypothetical protein
MNTAALHHIDCEWHHDQYDRECTCGAVKNLSALRREIAQMDIVERIRSAIHLESAAIAPQTSALIEAARAGIAEIERYRSIATKYSRKSAEAEKTIEWLRGSIRTLFPENFTGPFICGHGGEESNGLPDLLHVCVSYGADWTVTYKRMPSTFTLEQECVEEIARLRAALEWYAGDGSTYDGIDVGQKAREALKPRSG